MQYNRQNQAHMRFTIQTNLKSANLSHKGFNSANLKQVEGKVGNFKCNRCGFSSDKPQNIRDHVQMMHALEVNRVGRKPNFLNLTSNQEIKFKCTKCKFQTPEPSMLRDHVSVHA